MSVVESNIQVTPFACRDVIGVRGICDTVYPYNLDTLGISLSKAAKLSDSSRITGKELVQGSVDIAWGTAFSDLKIDGFKVAGVNKTYSGEFSETQIDSGTFTQTLQRGCDIERFFFANIQLKVVGTLTAMLTINYNGVTQTLYNAALTDESLIVNIDNEILTSKIIVTLTTTGSGKLYLVDQNELGSSPILINGYLECSEKLFFCKYWSFLITAVMYKAAAIILNASIFNDRYNDILAYKKDEIALRIAQLDSSLNLLNAENRINAGTLTQKTSSGNFKTGIGLYQAEIEKLNLRLKDIARDQHCTCCFNCDQIIKSKITMM